MVTLRPAVVSSYDSGPPAWPGRGTSSTSPSRAGPLSKARPRSPASRRASSASLPFGSATTRAPGAGRQPGPACWVKDRTAGTVAGTPGGTGAGAAAAAEEDGEGVPPGEATVEPWGERESSRPG